MARAKRAREKLSVPRVANGRVDESPIREPTKRVDMKLRWRRFAENYAMTRRPTESAIRAGYAPDTAARSAKSLLENKQVLEWINDFENARRLAIEVHESEVIAELAAIAFADIRDYLEVDHKGTISIKPMHQIDGLAIKAVQELHMGPHGPRLRLYSKKDALQMLGTYKSMWREDPSRKPRDADLSQYTDEELERIAAGEDDDAPDGGNGHAKPPSNGGNGSSEPSSGSGGVSGLH